MALPPDPSLTVGDTDPDDEALSDDAEGPGPAPPPDVPVHLGESAHIGKFAVIRQLGAGGMGVVYSAYDEELDRRVAIKLLRPDRDHSSRNQARMQREARAMATLSHPNVVQVYEVGRHDDQVFLAMEFVPGTTLAAWLRAETRTWQQVLDVMLQAGRGLQAAHEAGVVHADFKPDNVLIDVQGKPRVVDFGLSRRVDPSELSLRAPRIDDETQKALAAHAAETGDRGGVRSSARIAGTPAYMAAEQHRHRPADQRSDQFSFCVTLYAALYGRHPFASASLIGLVLNVCDGKVHPPPANTTVPPGVHAAVLRGLSPDPEARFPSMEGLLDALDRGSGRARDPEFDLSVARRQRILVSGAIALSAITVTLLFGLSTDDRIPTPVMAVAAAAVCNAVLLVLIWLQRRALLKNEINRRVMAWLVVSSLAILVHRAAALYIDITAGATLVNDLLLLSVIALMAAVTVERWIAWAALLMFSACLAILAAPLVAPIVLVATTLGVFAIATYFWAR